MARRKSLHQQHAAAHAVSANALSVFHALASDLHRAADEHLSVAVAASDQIAELDELRSSAGEAAERSRRQAEAIRSLVG